MCVASSSTPVASTGEENLLDMDTATDHHQNLAEMEMEIEDDVVIIAPAMGMFFWWQWGVALALKEHYNLKGVRWAGVSSGSILCAVANCEVDPVKAHDLAYKLTDERGCFSSPRGLMGVWGELVTKWLDELLPTDAHIVAADVSILISRLKGWMSGFAAESVTAFPSRDDLIETIMSSAHIPWFMDGAFSHAHRGGRAVDGGLMIEFGHGFGKSYAEHLAPGVPESSIFELQYLHDEVFCEEAKKNWWFRLSPRGANDMLRLGTEFVVRETAKESTGRLAPLEHRRRRRADGAAEKAIRKHQAAFREMVSV